MYQLPFFWCGVIALLLVACQPIRPESELATPGTSSPSALPTSTVTSTVAVAESAVITQSAAITGGSELTTSAAITVALPASPSSTPADSPSTTTTTTGTVPSTPSTGASATTCPAIGNEALDIAVLADWEVGEQRHYELAQRRTEGDSRNKVVSLASSTPVTVTVISAESDGYVLEWSYGQTNVGFDEMTAPDPLATLMEMPLQVHIRFATDADGAYLELLNLEELQAQLRPLFDQLIDAIAETDDELAPEALEAIRGMVDRIVDDPANFEALFTGEIQTVHTLYGMSFEEAVPIVMDDLRPNMLGGDPIPSKLTITPTHYDAESGCLIVELENIADPVAARNSVLEALQEQARQMGVPGPSEDDLPDELTLNDTVRFEFDLQSGWPTAIYMERAIVIADQERIEEGQIILVDPDVP